MCFKLLSLIAVAAPSAQQQGLRKPWRKQKPVDGWSEVSSPGRASLNQLLRTLQVSGCRGSSAAPGGTGDSKGFMKNKKQSNTVQKVGLENTTSSFKMFFKLCSEQLLVRGVMGPDSAQVRHGL